MNQVQAELQRFKKDTAYYEEHHEEILGKYPEQWVAIYNQQVVGASPDYEQLLADVEEQGVPIGRALFKHLTQKEELWILSSSVDHHSPGSRLTSQASVVEGS